jgi:hypothetical protein
VPGHCASSFRPGKIKIVTRKKLKSAGRSGTYEKRVCRPAPSGTCIRFVGHPLSVDIAVLNEHIV